MLDSQEAGDCLCCDLHGFQSHSLIKNNSAGVYMKDVAQPIATGMPLESLTDFRFITGN